ncbi:MULTISPECIES: hypothetical protein [unclassified Micromonospora]|nr:MULTISPECIES: hypothetical protein [unclassified Micromonospora]WSG05283.1 hypothetical protein OG989_17015 [Micromonospora sp. NBC_01740]
MVGQFDGGLLRGHLGQPGGAPGAAPGSISSISRNLHWFEVVAS